jgi:EAL domain-containing protein (putative c-di-GMP-specific phosphodiesterase class I)
LRQALRNCERTPHAPPIAVNISGRSFDDPALPNYIADELREFAPTRPLLIEITETAAVSDLTDAQRFIEALKQTGCGVCLDDFGAGFASFAYLKHIRVDTIKLDGMFIRNLPTTMKTRSSCAAWWKSRAASANPPSPNASRTKPL